MGKRSFSSHPSAGFTRPVETRSVAVQWVYLLSLSFLRLYDYGLGLFVFDPLIQ